MRKSSAFVALLFALAWSAAAQPFSASEEIPPRVQRLEQWLSAVATHQPGAVDDSVREVSTWSQGQLGLIVVDLNTIVSLIREPSVSLFYISEPLSRRAAERAGPARPTSPGATNRSTQVLYTAGELRALRRLAKTVSPEGKVGPENDVLKRGAMLHADIEILIPIERRGASNPNGSGPGVATLFMDDGQQLGLKQTISHWNMGRRLLDRVRPLNSKSSIKTAPDPAADDTIRLWYVASLAHMVRIRRIDPDHFTRALDLFPNDQDLLFLGASAHENFAGARTQSVFRTLKVPRDVTFGVLDEAAELRTAEQMYKRALERNPQLLEARIRLGRVLGARGRHEEAVTQLKQGLSSAEPVLQYYANLFLGAEFEALGNGIEARQSYQRAAELAPTSQSPLLGLSRLADVAGDRAAAREAVDRLLRLPPSEFDRADPWWIYEIVQARHVDGLLAQLRQRF